MSFGWGLLNQVRPYCFVWFTWFLSDPYDSQWLSSECHDSRVILMILMIFELFSSDSHDSQVILMILKWFSWFLSYSQVILKWFSWFLNHSCDSYDSHYYHVSCDSWAILVILNDSLSNSHYYHDTCDYLDSGVIFMILGEILMIVNDNVIHIIVTTLM